VAFYKYNLKCRFVQHIFSEISDVLLDILIVFVDYQKQLIDDSPDFENTRGTVLCAVYVK